MRSFSASTLTAALLIGLSQAPKAFSQNDWQYPDPYFGVVEIEKSHPSPPAVRKYREGVSPAPQQQERVVVRGRTRLLRPRPRPAAVSR